MRALLLCIALAGCGLQTMPPTPVHLDEPAKGPADIAADMPRPCADGFHEEAVFEGTDIVTCEADRGYAVQARPAE